MNDSDGVVSRECLDGFEAFSLGNAQSELVIIPAVGARIVRLRRCAGGRDWVWHPAGGPRLRAALPGSSFEGSGHGGIDECLPTIAACTLEGLALPDHGEVWPLAWRVGEAASAKGAVRTTVTLPVSGLEFTRTISLRAGQVRLDYVLVNPTPRSRRYLWAWHPLLAMRPGDRLLLPEEIAALRMEVALGQQSARAGDRWAWPLPFPGYDLASLTLGASEGACLKGFAGPLRRGGEFVVRLQGADGESLALRWASRENAYCGVWLARGYRGWHHLAIEPTNAPVDRLDQVPDEAAAGTIVGPGEERRWSVEVTLGGG